MKFYINTQKDFTEIYYSLMDGNGEQKWFGTARTFPGYEWEIDVVGQAQQYRDTRNEAMEFLSGQMLAFAIENKSGRDVQVIAV